MSHSVWFLGSLWYKELSEPYESLNKTVLAGFDGAEVSIEYPLLDEKDVDIIALHDFSRNYFLGVHLPWRDVNLASPIPEIRDGALRYLQRVISVLDRAEPRYYVLHVTTSSIGCRNSIKCVEKAASVLTELSKVTSTKVIVETTAGPCCGNASAIGLLISEAEGIGVCLDIAQLVAEFRGESEVGSRELIKRITESLPPNIWSAVELVHVHGWDTRGRKVILHRYPSDEQLLAINDFLRTVLEKTGKLVAVFEVFYDRRGNQMHSWELGELLREVSRGVLS